MKYVAVCNRNMVEYIWNTLSTALVVSHILLGIWMKFLSMQTARFAESVVPCYGFGFGGLLCCTGVIMSCLEGCCVVLALYCHVWRAAVLYWRYTVIFGGLLCCTGVILSCLEGCCVVLTL